jgi:hypothetical protein
MFPATSSVSGNFLDDFDHFHHPLRVAGAVSMVNTSTLALTGFGSFHEVARIPTRRQPASGRLSLAEFDTEFSDILDRDQSLEHVIFVDNKQLFRIYACGASPSLFQVKADGDCNQVPPSSSRWEGRERVSKRRSRFVKMPTNLPFFVIGRPKSCSASSFRELHKSDSETS